MIHVYFNPAMYEQAAISIYIYIGNYGKRGRTTSSEKKKNIYIYTVKNLKKFKNLIKIDVSVRDLHQLQCK